MCSDEIILTNPEQVCVCSDEIILTNPKQVYMCSDEIIFTNHLATDASIPLCLATRELKKRTSPCVFYSIGLSYSCITDVNLVFYSIGLRLSCITDVNLVCFIA